MGKSEIEGVELAVLQQYIDTGRRAEMPEEMVEYLSQLELVRGQLLRFENKGTILEMLQNAPYNLSQYTARKRVADAINFFYIDKDVKRDAWRGIYADKLDRIATATLRAAKDEKGFKMAADIFRQAAEMRGVFDDEPEQMPEEMFAKPVKIYTMDITQLGHDKVNRHELAKMIDSYNISESSKQRVKEDAFVETPNFLADEA